MARRVKRTRKGAIELKLTEPEREFLRSLAPQMRELFDTADDPAVARLFPDAYPEDEERQSEYRLLAHPELMDNHLAALDALESTADADVLDAGQADSWLKAINEVRLVLGTRLDVTEEGDERPRSLDDPRAAAFAAYDYLSGLQAELIEALTS